MNVLIAGLDVKRAGSNKRALTKKEDDHLETKEESEDRIPNKEMLKKEVKLSQAEKKENVNDIPKNSAHYKHRFKHVSLPQLYLISSLSPPHLGHLPVADVGHGHPAHIGVVRALIVDTDGDITEHRGVSLTLDTLRFEWTSSGSSLHQRCPGSSSGLTNHNFNPRPLVSDGGGGKGQDGDGGDAGAHQPPEDEETAGHSHVALTSHIADTLFVLTVMERVTQRACQVTNYDKQQEHPEQVYGKADLLAFTCETKFTFLNPSPVCDRR